MTYLQLKTLVGTLLRGDTEIPPDNEFIMLLKYGLSEIANDANALKLITAKTEGERILRNGPGNTFIRMPKEPEDDNEELDLDEELCYALARYIAYFLSNTGKAKIHLMEAKNIINKYNQKVDAYFEELESQGRLSDGVSTYGTRRYYD